MKKVHIDVQAALKEYYKKLTEDKVGNAAEIKDLMDCVIDAKGKKLPEQLLQKFHKTIDEKETNEGGTWIPWKEAVAKYGEDILTEMVTAKTISSRPSALLPPNTKIEWPRNLEVAAITESWNNKRSSIDETSNAVDAGSSTDFQTKFEEYQNMNKKMRVSTEGKQAVNKAGVPADKVEATEQEKVAVANIRKGHNAWDRSMREFSALVAKSASHVNTKGCKFELDLKALILRGKKDDEVLQKLEQKFMLGDSLKHDDLKLAASTCTTIADLIKTGNKKAQGLKSWFKIDE
jgi:hypothetical protein